MLYKRDFYTLILERVPIVGGGYPPPTPFPRSVASLPRRGPQTNVPLSRFCPSKTQSVPARLVISYRKTSSRGAYYIWTWSFLKCFWRVSTWFHNNIYYNGTIYIIIVLSDLVESSGYSSKTLQKGSCPIMRLWIDKCSSKHQDFRTQWVIQPHVPFSWTR